MRYRLVQLRARLTYANVVATLALFVALTSGAAFAASRLGKNTVGTKQLQKNAVTGVKVKNGSLTGADVALPSLGTVPSAATAATAARADTATTAASAGTAQSANTANRANTAGTADVASSLTPLEASHIVGAAGEPPFLNESSSFSEDEEEGEGYPPVAFYKDHEGIVHLEGVVKVGGGKEPGAGLLFDLPPGFQPSGNVVQSFNVESEDLAFILIAGADVSGGIKFPPGAVATAAKPGTSINLNEISFRTN